MGNETEILQMLCIDLPRQGPGSNKSTTKAWQVLAPYLDVNKPRIIDFGCGSGIQTIELARLSGGDIIAIDTGVEFLRKLSVNSHIAGVADKIKTINVSMLEPGLEEESFDVIWAEGSIYIIGFEFGLKLWRNFLKDGGCMAVTECCWLKDDVPDELREFWSLEYPGMLTKEECLDIIDYNGFELIEAQTLPESDWWDEYYTPVCAMLDDMKNKYSDDPEVMQVLSLFDIEINMYRKYSKHYGYVFYIMRKKNQI